MPARSTIQDSFVDIEISSAESETSPERLRALDAAYELSPAQCLRVGEAIDRVAQARYEDEEIEDFDDLDPDDWLEEQTLYATALQILGGETWAIETEYARRMSKGETLGYRTAVSTLDGWVREGWASLLEPAEVRLPWPAGSGRKAALKLAGELVPLLDQAADLEPVATQAIKRAIEESLKLDPQDAEGLAQLHEALRAEGYPRVDADEAARVAEEASTNQAWNQRAYRSHIVSLVFEAALSALEKTPDFTCLFNARVQIIHPTYALEQCLDRYYSSGAAGFDELFNFDEDKQGAIASRLICELLEEAALLVCQQRRKATSSD